MRTSLRYLHRRRNGISNAQQSYTHEKSPFSGGYTSAGVPPSRGAYFKNEIPAPLPNSPSYDVVMRAGRELADKAKYMTDAQWENVPLKDKGYFTRYMAQMLQHSPSEVSEHQKRRYYETTGRRVNIREEMITNPYQRMKSSLPFDMDTRGRNITVSEAIMQDADESEFDAEKAKQIEYAQLHFKQAFKDYVANRRAGVSTEAERRKLSDMAQSLHHVVQRHLANTYKYADARLHDAVKQKALNKLAAIAKFRKRASDIRDGLSGEGTESGQIRENTQHGTATAPANRTEIFANKYGINVEVANAMWESMKAQDEFLERLEVLNRLCSGHGFAHTSSDESLNEYGDRLQSLLSLDPNHMGRLDAVQYYARLEEREPIDWARRWYEKHLLYPIHLLPEYQKLEELSKSGSSEILQHEAQERVNGVQSFAGLIFDGLDTESVHQQRIRHLAFTYMHIQIARMRAKCLKYQKMDMEAESQRVQELLRGMRELNSDFSNPEVLRRHGEIQKYVTEVIERCRDQMSSVGMEGSSLEETPESSSEQVREAILSRDPKRVDAEVQRLERRNKAEQVLRLLRILEEDVRSDVQWYEAYEEAERPPLIPEPEPYLYISANDARNFGCIKELDDKNKANPFVKLNWNVNFLGKALDLPTAPILFWGTGVAAVQQALAYEVEKAKQRRRGPAPEEAETGSEDVEKNPWGWRENPQGVDKI